MKPGNQEPERMVHQAGSGVLALLQRRLCWCWRTVHWLPLIATPQYSQIVTGRVLHHCSGRSPTSSRQLGSMPRPC